MNSPDDFYSMLQEAESAEATLKLLAERDIERARTFARENQRKLEMLPALRNISRMAADARKADPAVQSKFWQQVSPLVSGAQK